MSTPYVLTINVRYSSGSKAARFFSNPSSNAVAQLKHDLERLNFPIPDESCISFVSPGCMKAVWIAPLGSSLYRRLKMLVYRTKSPGLSYFWDSTRPSQLEIDWITLQETPVDIAQRQHAIPAIPVHCTTTRKRAHTIESPVDSGETHKLSVTPHGIQHTLGPRPRPAKRSKTDDTGRMPDVLVYPAQARQNIISQVVPPQSGLARKSNQPRPSWLALPFNMAQTREADSPTSAQSPSAREAESIPPYIENHQCESVGDFSTSSPMDISPGAGVDHGVKVQQIEKMVLNLRRNLVIGVHKEISRIKKRKPKYCTPVPRGQDSTTSKVTEIEYELQVERAARRKLEEIFNNVQNTMEILQVKLTEMDVEYSSEQQRREELEKELASERKKRTEVENVLKDVERECRAPFVVPAMMEAFKTISRLTTCSLDRNRSKSST